MAYQIKLNKWGVITVRVLEQLNYFKFFTKSLSNLIQVKQLNRDNPKR